MQIIKVDFGKTVLCDWCGEDYSDSDEKGGILFGSKATCPKCTPDMIQKAIQYSEQRHIKTECPASMSFKNWVLGMR